MPCLTCGNWIAIIRDPVRFRSGIFQDPELPLIELAIDSPLEGDGFEPPVPR
jgi:hypothetical protein